MNRILRLLVCLLAVACFLVASPGYSIRASSNEGYDPMLQITHQFARANIYIVQDVSGSMAWDINGRDVGVDSTGTIPTGKWRYYKRDCSWQSGKCKYWTYKLTVYQTLPSRMATVKNALGNSVTLITPWEPPPEWSASGYSYITNANWGLGGIISGPTVRNSSGRTTYTWKVGFRNKRNNPGAPFTAYDGSSHLTVGSGGVSEPPADLIGKTSDLINWGLIIFSTSYGNCTTQTLRVAVDSYDTGDVSALEGWLELYKNGGLHATGGTPTRGALTYAKTELKAVFDSDPKYDCPRTYGAILVTDGESNSCNPSGGSWSSCPDNYTSYPAGISEQLWNLNLSRNGSTPKKVRTWVIGVSHAVGRCELDFTAYMGRTDASSPNGDAGFDTAGDPYLPASTGDTSKYDTTHGDYAYFATSASALKKAFASIVASVATGDYTSSPPVTGSDTASDFFAFVGSVGYPSWKGHLYAYDLSNDPAPLAWDAGANLSDPYINGSGVPSPTGTTANPAYVAPAKRKIYTWNSSNNLIEVNAFNLSSIRSAATAFGPSGFDSTTLTTNVIDFIRGNNGSGVGRSWRLGPIINSTPAVIGAPFEYGLGDLPDHASFESTYKDRTALVWVGAGDGMLHAFKVSDGSEVMALLPPNMLAKEVTLYDNYLSDPSKLPVGQSPMPADQLYGVAGSPRYSDIYFNAPVKSYKTVMVLTEGPGGDLMAGINVTDVVSGDTNYAIPEVLWTKTKNSLSGLYETWCVPALASVSVNASKTKADFRLLSGAGFNPSSTSSSQVVPKELTFDPTNGSSAKTSTLGSDTTGTYVGNQSFADSALLNKTADFYLPDNIADLGIQADLKGRIWFLSGLTSTPTVTLGVDAEAKAGQAQPIYYSPGVTGYDGYDLFIFGSGTPYEKSPNITGQNIGTAGYFIPSLYIVAKGQDVSKATNTQILRIPIENLYVPNADGTPSTTHFGPRSQVTASPMLLTPAGNTSGLPVALFLVFDPDSGLCGGTSYIVMITFDIDKTSGAPTVGSSGGGAPPPGTPGISVYSAGEGAASGFAIAGNSVIVAKSHVGSGGQAGISTVPNVHPTAGMTTATAPLWWRELK